MEKIVTFYKNKLKIGEKVKKEDVSKRLAKDKKK